MSKQTGTIEVELITRYGVGRYYPRNEAAEYACSLVDQETLTEKNIKDLKGLGLTIKQVVTVKGKNVEVDML